MIHDDNELNDNENTIILSIYDDNYDNELNNNDNDNENENDNNNENDNELNDNENTIISSIYNDNYDNYDNELNNNTFSNIIKINKSRQYDKNYGFIISRYVHSIKTNHYWNIFNNWKSIFYAIMFTIFVCANETVV
jgi:hypothetical protein